MNAVQKLKKEIKSHIKTYGEFKNRVIKWRNEVMFPKTIKMWSYINVDDSQQGFRLDHLLQRIEAADQLGYKVEVRSAGKDIEVYYVKKTSNDLQYI